MAKSSFNCNSIFLCQKLKLFRNYLFSYKKQVIALCHCSGCKFNQFICNYQTYSQKKANLIEYKHPRLHIVNETGDANTILNYLISFCLRDKFPR